MQTDEIKYPFLPLREINRRFEPELTEAVMRVVRSGRYIGGEEVARFEQSLAEMCGVDSAVGLSTGLDALRLILRAMIALGRLSAGDRVIVPANSFIASALAVVDAGLIPVFADPSSTDFLIHASEIERLVHDYGAKAVMPVDLYGKLAVDEELLKICRKRELIIVEDAAQAVGASRLLADGSEHRPGTWSHAAAFSFYPAKNVGALGDAGAVVTDDRELADMVRTLANYGESERYRCTQMGFNCRLDPIQAAALRVKLPHSARENLHRRNIAHIYCEKLEPSSKLIIPQEPEAGDTVHQFVVRCVGIDRAMFRRKLEERGVETAVHYPIAINRQPAMKDYFDAGNPCRIAESLSRQVVSLPVSSATSDSDALAIANIINDVIIEEL